MLGKLNDLVGLTYVSVTRGGYKHEVTQGKEDGA